MWKIWLGLGLASLALGIFGLVHQKIWAGVWFTWEQFWHHEPLIGMAVSVGITLVIVAMIEYRRMPKT